MMLKTIGLFGGTFDPIHKGHVASALELKRRLQLDQLRFIPCHRPPHREAVNCDSQQRLTMVKLALSDDTQLYVDDREIKRDAVSYTVDTLEQFRQELGDQVSLCWIMGTDAFASLDSWHRWQALLELAHLVVITRPDCQLPAHGPVARLMQQHQSDDVCQLTNRAAGTLHFESLSAYPISSTAIRNAIHAYYNCAHTIHPLRHDTFLQSVLAQSVLNYIDRHQLYR